MIHITAIGNAGRDPEKRGGDRGPVVFSLAVSSHDRGTDEKRTDWFDAVCFGLTGKRAQERVTKGVRVLVVGRMETRTAQDGREYRSIVASDISVEGGRSVHREQREARGRDDGPPPHEDEDVPF